METLSIGIFGIRYRMFRLKVFAGTANERTVTVAENKLDRKIKKLIKDGRREVVEDIAELYEYSLPTGINLSSEKKIRESVENAIRTGEEIKDNQILFQ